MAKQIIVSFPGPIGASCRDSEANYLADMADEMSAAVAERAVGMLAGSAWVKAHAIIADGDTSQDAADAIAQGIFDGGITTGPWKASEIDSAGNITELTDPTPS
jgi:hypothetical protein